MKNLNKYLNKIAKAISDDPGPPKEIVEAPDPPTPTDHMFKCISCKDYVKAKLDEINWLACKKDCNRLNRNDCDEYDPLINPDWEPPEDGPPDPTPWDGSGGPDTDLCGKWNKAKDCHRDMKMRKCWDRVWRCHGHQRCTDEQMCDMENRECYECMHTPPNVPEGGHDNRSGCDATNYCKIHKLKNDKKFTDCIAHMRNPEVGCCSSDPGDWIL